MNYRVIYFLAGAILILSCKGKYNFIKYDNGLWYYIQHEGDGETVQPMQTVKLRLKQVYKDSVLRDMTDSLPYYQVQDSTQLSKPAFNIFSQVRKGDSIVFKALTDSVFKDKMPPFARKGKWLYTHVYIEDVFVVGEDYREDMKREMRKRHMSNPE